MIRTAVVQTKRTMAPAFLSTLQDAGTRMLYGAETATEKTHFYDLVDKDMDGNEVKMDKFKGEVCIVVNVASFWGLTKTNYVQFSKMYEAYNSRGLKILAFPSNQFGKQEPGTNEDILDFVEKNFQAKDKVTWFDKGDVNGAAAREVFSFLKAKLPWEDGTSDIRWNFGKFLIDSEGTPFKRFGSKTPPEEMKADIEELLKKKEAAETK